MKNVFWLALVACAFFTCEIPNEEEIIDCYDGRLSYYGDENALWFNGELLSSSESEARYFTFTDTEFTICGYCFCDTEENVITYPTLPPTPEPIVPSLTTSINGDCFTMTYEMGFGTWIEDGFNMDLHWTDCPEHEDTGGLNY